MPQILINTAPTGRALDVNGRALSASHAQIVGILRHRLGAHHADLLAQPQVQGDGSITWTTPLTGPVLRAAALPAEERLALERRAERFAADILGLVQQLRAEATATSNIVARSLELALLQPTGDWLFSVDGKPVRVLWGHADADAPLPPEPVAPVASIAPTAPAAPGLAPAPTQTSAASSLAAAPGVSGLPSASDPVPPATAAAAVLLDAAAPARGSPSVWLQPWPWLALLLLAAVAAAAWLWFKPVAGDAALAEQIAQAQARNQALAAQLAAGGGARPRLQCAPDPAEPPASAPVPEPPASMPAAPAPVAAASAPPAPVQPAPAPPAASRPAAPADPIDSLKKRVANAAQDCRQLAALLRSEPLLKGQDPAALAIRMQMLQTMQQSCRDQAIQEARNSCPGQRPPELAPEMALVFDASGSMNFSLDLTPEELRQAQEADAAQKFAGALGALLGLPGMNQTPAAVERIFREPKRITAARQSALDLARRVPADMGVGLVLVDACPSARPVGMFAPGQRGELVSRIEAIKPRAGTPLADGVAQAGNLVDGTTREALIVVISDGEESCGRDPCAVAAELKRAKPFLKINVVDITGTGAGNCLAQITGGKVFTANSADDVAAMTERAAQDAMPPARCKP